MSTKPGSGDELRNWGPRPQAGASQKGNTMKAFLMCLGMLAAALAACDCNGQEYEIDGVPVVLEEGTGPTVDHMTLAVEKYRGEAALRWRLTADEETPVWRALQEIRWTIETVPNRIAYDVDSRKIRATWLGCALNVALYGAFTLHYARVLQQGEGPTDDDRQWAQELEDSVSAALCQIDI